ncbi:Uma2 family endonuclease [Paraconexibacter sp. AEG42_29]
MTSTATRMTRAQFLARGEKVDARRYELLDGELIVDEPTTRHQMAFRELLYELTHWARGGPRRGQTIPTIDTDIGPRTILAPDLQWYADGRAMNDIDSRPQPHGDIAIEIRSPSTWHYDVGRKRAAYEAVGVQEYWLVDPSTRTIVILGRSAPDAPTFDTSREVSHDDVLTSPLLPGFAVPVTTLLPA